MNSPATWPLAPPPASQLRPFDAKNPIGNLRIRIFGDPIHIRGLASNPFSFRALAALHAADVIHCHQRHIVMSSLSAVLGRLTSKCVFVSDLGGGGWDISRYVSTENWFHGHLHISRYSREISKQAEQPRAHVIMGGVDTEKFLSRRHHPPHSIRYLRRPHSPA